MPLGASARSSGLARNLPRERERSPRRKPPKHALTDHEHLEKHGLIHMSGRVFDPLLTRFLSAAPFMDDATDAQAYNRES